MGLKFGGFDLKRLKSMSNTTTVAECESPQIVATFLMSIIDRLINLILITDSLKFVYHGGHQRWQPH